MDDSQRYTDLKRFLKDEMRMSHIYQPVMLMCLIDSGGTASREEVARSLLSWDQSQVEYYEQIVQNMVGRVLTKNRGITSKAGRDYSLNGFNELTSHEVQSLRRICEEKIREYIERRGRKIWQHRTKSEGYISGTIRYDVLKRARYRCELCGVGAEQKALEVDHIVPRNHGGTDDLSNLQALCYSCNAMKRDRDDTDFRGMAASYKHRDADCVFCTLGPDRIIGENELALAIRDAFPVSEGHTLIIPKRHVLDYFELHQPEINAIHQLLAGVREELQASDPAIGGFNVGINSGKSAGQTVMHCHMHLIPRRAGDTPHPEGGVRGVIPDKQSY